MAQYEEGKYISVNIDLMIKAGIAPFDCYLLFRASSNLVPIVKKDQAISIIKLKKIAAKEKTTLFTEAENTELYKSFLGKLFSLPMGIEALRVLQSEGNGDDIHGIPVDFDLFQYLKDVPTAMVEDVAASAPKSIVEQKNLLVKCLEAQANSIKSVFAGHESEVIQKQKVLAEANLILNALKKINSSGSPTTPKDILVIKNTNEYIQTRMLILSKLVETIDPEYEKIIGPALLKANQNAKEINELRDSLAQPDKFAELKKFSFAMETHMRFIGKRSAESTGDLSVSVGQMFEQLKQATIQMNIGPSPDQIVARNKDSLILKLSALVRRQQKIILDLKNANTHLQRDYEHLKRNFAQVSDVASKEILAPPMGLVKASMAQLQKRQLELNELQNEMDSVLQADKVVAGLQSGVSEEDLKAMGIEVPVPEAKVAPSVDLVDESTSAEVSSAESASTEVMTEVVAGGTAPLPSDEGSQTDAQSLELARAFLAQNSDKNKIIEALAAEKSALLKMGRLLNAEKSKLKEVLAKLEDRDVTTKAAETELKALRNQVIVEGQKREKAEKSLKRSIEEGKQYQGEIQRLRSSKS